MKPRSCVSLLVGTVLVLLSRKTSLGFVVESPICSRLPKLGFNSCMKGFRSISPTSSLALSPHEAWEAYNSALISKPLVTKSVTASVILGFADLAGQFVERKQGKTEEGVDLIRAARFAVFGLVLQAPWNHFYYLFLDSKIPPTEDPFTVTNGAKVVIDQFVQAPIFTVLIFVFLGLLEGKSVQSIKGQLESDYGETIVANCEFFIIVSLSSLLRFLTIPQGSYGFLLQ